MVAVVGFLGFLFDELMWQAFCFNLWPPFFQVLASQRCMRAWCSKARGVVREEVPLVVKVLLQSCLSGVADGCLARRQGSARVELTLLLTVSHAIMSHRSVMVVLTRIRLLLYPGQDWVVLGLDTSILAQSELLCDWKLKRSTAELATGVTKQLFEL